MKCPKCHYLGFETGDRCKNCGYDFSLLTAPASPDPDLMLRDPDRGGPVSPQWLEHLDHALDPLPAPAPVEAARDPFAPMPLDTIAAPVAPASSVASPARTAAAEAPRVGPRAVTPPLPLFQPGAGDDQPLIKVPAAPRPPLAVRRTPQKPRLRAVPKPAHATEAVRAAVADAEPVLEFAEDAGAEPAAQDGSAAAARALGSDADVSPPGRRLAAAALDHALLVGIDLVVVYFTLKMASLSFSDWRAIPPIPLLAFLALIKVAYFSAFTLVGGQTVGKMAAQIRVVADEGVLDPPRAMRRTLAGGLSLLTLGLGLLPMFLAADRRALHDRLARTRVVTQFW